jgi:malonyl-CoA O-methyltransferase
MFNNNLDFSSRISREADMVWCNMQLHMHPDPLALMRAWSEALNSQGYVMFSCLGPDSLRELRALFEEESWPPAHADFTDMHDWGDMLLQAGFAQPIMDMEHMTLTYASAEDLLRDLRTLGRNLHPQRFAGLRGRAWYRQLLQALQKKLASAAHQGRLALTFEVIYGHAFKASKVAKRDVPAVVSLDDMKKMLSTGGKTL